MLCASAQWATDPSSKNCFCTLKISPGGSLSSQSQQNAIPSAVCMPCSIRISAFPYLPIASRSLGATPPRCNQHILLHFKTMSIRLCVFHLTTTTMALYKCYYASKAYDCTWEWQCVLEIYFGSPHFLLHFDPIALFVFMVSSFISCSLYLSLISSTVRLSIILCYPVARAQYIS